MENLDSIDSGDDIKGEQLQNRRLVQQHNKLKTINRKTKSFVKSGTFQSFGFSVSVLRGIKFKGYKQPTPIQRRVIPEILAGRDVVAMARTGSGKTATFLLPMLEKLRCRGVGGEVATSSHAIRALILSPTRELALQTLKFAKELGRFAGLTAAVVLGGDGLDEQFAALHARPDLLIATPGRLLHVCMEMELRLNNVEYVVLDEADRLLELGFAEQLNELLHRLPESRQTLLFSATLPARLVDFARAGLHNPKLVRLDVDSKLSSQLQLHYFHCRPDEKTALLLSLLTTGVQTPLIPLDCTTVLFAATKHHVEYLSALLTKAGVSNTYVYSALDSSARKINTDKFLQRKVRVLVVTDLAARGIDIPVLDYVINYNFPAQPKLFVHRVGRVARAGRSGVAFSLVSHNEMPYLLDVHLFLGRSLRFASDKVDERNGAGKEALDGVVGTVPQIMLDFSIEQVRLVESGEDIVNLKQVAERAMKQYSRSIPSASRESVRRWKELAQTLSYDSNLLHPLLQSLSQTQFLTKQMHESDLAVKRQDMLMKLRNATTSTIFEFKGGLGGKNACEIMRNKRIMCSKSVDRYHNANANKSLGWLNNISSKSSEKMDDSHEDKVGGQVDVPFISYKPANYDSEKGLQLSDGAHFEQNASAAVLDFMVDEGGGARRSSTTMHTPRKVWNRKLGRFVGVSNHGGNKKMRTESGALIPASYKTQRYSTWLKHNPVNDNGNSDHTDRLSQKQDNSRLKVIGTRKRNFHTQNNKSDTKPVGHRERRLPEQILKERKRKAKIHSFQQKKQKKGGGGGGGKRR